MPRTIRPKVSELRFPLGGLERGGAYPKQPPFTTPNAQNVWPIDAYEERARGGSRPGIDRAFDTQLGSGNPIRLLDYVTVIAQDGFHINYDDFTGPSLGDRWSAATWIDASLPDITNDLASLSANNTRGAVLDALASIDNTKSYEIGIFIVPSSGSHHGEYQIFGGMNDSTPNAETDGFVVEIDMTTATGTWTGTLKSYDGGVLQTDVTLTAGVADLGYAPSGWLKVLYDASTPNVKVYWRGTLIKDQNISLGGSAGDRVGFGMDCTEAGGTCLVDTFQVQYYDSTLRETRRDIAIAASNGVLSYETYAGTFTASASALRIQTDRRIDSAQRQQVLYIADHGLPVKGTSVAIAGTTVTLAAITTSTVDAQDCIVEISSGTGTVTNGLYTISSVGAGSLTLNSSAGTGNATVRIERAPKTYTPSTDTLALLTASAGQFPVGAQHICFYRDRLCLGIDHVLYMSRQGDPTDWDNGVDPDDPQKSIYSTDADAGQIGDVITGLMPFSDDYLVIGCKNSIWVMQGDLAYGGQVNNITYDTGVVMRGAWCRGPRGGIYFLGTDGINYIPPGPNVVHENLSGDRLPQELQHINTLIYQVAMIYDHERHGVHIYLTPDNPTQKLHWWYDTKHNGFWPMEIPTDSDPTNVMQYRGISPAIRGPLIGCRDGYVKHYRESEETDSEGTEIDNYVDIGPFALGDLYQAGMLDQLICALAEESGNVTWSVRVGDSAEEVSDSTSNFDTGTFVAGANYPVIPRAYGKFAIVRLEAAAANRAWALDRLSAIYSKRGQHRLT